MSLKGSQTNVYYRKQETNYIIHYTYYYIISENVFKSISNSSMCKAGRNYELMEMMNE